MRNRIRNRYVVLKNIIPYAYGVKRYWVMLVILGSGIAGADILIPKLYQLFVDKVILEAQLEKLGIIVAGYLLIFIIKVILGCLQKWGEYRFNKAIVYNIREKIMQAFFNIPFSEYENIDTGDLQLRLDDDTNKLQELLIPQSVNYIMAYIITVVCSTVLFYMNGMIAVFSILAIPLTFKLDKLISNYENIIIDKRRENTKKESTWLHESVSGWQEIKALNLGRYQKKQFYHFLHTDMLLNAKWINYWTARTLIIPMIKNEFFMQFGLYLMGGILVYLKELTIGELLVISLYYSLLSDAVSQISKADADLYANMPYIDRVMETLEKTDKDSCGEKVEADKINNREENAELIGNKDKILKPISDSSEIVDIWKLENVSFKYPGTEKMVIRNLRFSIAKGERVAIIGKSGCGKSTLLKLLTGMLTPTGGQIYFSGMDMSKLDLEAVHRRIGYVMQENVLFHTTIRENILLGKESASEDEIWDFCKKARIYDFIMSLPQGLDTVIGERGIKLSGGQRQRIVLARTFLKDADIYIFDEATSALDEYSEGIVQDAIQNIGGNKTIIVVSHRESSLKLCDRVVDLECSF